MIILSPICKELVDFCPFPYYFLQMKSKATQQQKKLTKKKQKRIDHRSGMWKNGKPPIVPGKCLFK